MFVSALCAQRLNHQGKKMVRSVTSFVPNSPNREDTIKYNFYYDDERRLVKVDRLIKSIVFYPNVGWVKDKNFRLYRYCPWMRGMATSQISCNNGIDKKASHVPL